MRKLFTLSLVASLVLIGSFALYQTVLAIKGEGSATIDGGGNTTVERAVSHTFTVILTVGASGITIDAANPTFTLPAGFTTPNASPVATAGDVVSDGQWSAIGGATCPVTMSSSGASGQVMTVDVTTVCTVGSGGTITLTYKGTSVVTMGATALTIMTADDAGVPTPAVSLTGGSPTITVTDTIAPTVTIDSDKTTLKKGETAAITFTLSESSVNFIEGDVSVDSGTLSSFAGAGTSYTATFTPTDESAALATINVASATFTDTAGVVNTAATQKSMTVDTVAPTVTITMSDTTLTVGETSLVTFTFSEAPTGFDVTDVSLTNANGTIGVINAGDPLIQTATFTPTNSITDATNVIAVGTAWTDTALNAGIGDSSPNYTINTVAASSGGSNSQTGTIVVVKTVVNDNNGTKTVADFPLFVNGASVVSGVTNTFPAPAGVYTVTETSNVNYTQTFSSACDPSGRITLIPGDQKICVITNDDIGASVSVVPPLIDVVKTAGPLSLPNGAGPVTYTYTLRNIGTVPVTDITMIGDSCSPIVLTSGDTNCDLKLAVNEIWVYKCSTTLSATHTNIVTTTGWANGISAVDIASATVVVGAPVVPPLIHVTKVPNPLSLGAKVGIVTYTEKITNPGTIELSNVRLTDDKCSPMKYISGDTNNDSKLGTAETWTYTCQANLSKTTTNTATASGDANGLTAKDYAIVTVLVAAPGLPNTGFAPELMSMPWSIAFLFIIIAALILYFVRRK